MRRNIRSDAPWESAFGYSRAVRIGSHVSISGTAAVDAQGEVIAEDDAYRQATVCLEKIAAVLAQAGASLNDVIRTRMYVVNMARDAAAVGRAHNDCFHDIRPATAMIEVSRFIDPKMLVEVEADAVVEEPPPPLTPARSD